MLVAMRWAGQGSRKDALEVRGRTSPGVNLGMPANKNAPKQTDDTKAVGACAPFYKTITAKYLDFDRL